MKKLKSERRRFVDFLLNYDFDATVAHHSGGWPGSPIPVKTK